MHKKIFLIFLLFGDLQASFLTDVNNLLFSKDVKALGYPQSRRQQYRITRLESDKSFIESVKSYPLNIEARHVKTYAAGRPPSNSSTGSISLMFVIFLSVIKI